jgi:hypothetical protein
MAGLNKVFAKAAMLVVASLETAQVAADSCMVSPTTKAQVSGRFGKFREGGAANFNSGNTKPHMHDGLDFSTAGRNDTLMATTDGKVAYAQLRGSAGNTLMIQRPNGDYAVYYHMSGFQVKKGDSVTAGQPVGISGNTGMGPKGAIHLHFIYGVQNKDDARAKSFQASAIKQGMGVFNPAQLPSVLNKTDFGYATDPSPYFCQTFPIQSDGLESALGSDTKAQYAKLFGSTPTMGVPPSDPKLTPVQVAAANSDALVAQANGGGANGLAGAMSDTDGFGALPPPPIGDYSSMSVSDMMTTEARRRFADATWNTNITQVGSRALWVDYVHAVGVQNFLTERMYAKKERIEALLALYTSLKLAHVRAGVADAQARAQRDYVSQAIK